MIIVKDIQGYLTNIDRAKTPSNHASDLRGLRQLRDDMIAERDFGTVHRYSTPPIRPNAFKVISGIEIYPAQDLRVHCVGHGYSTNDVIYIDEIVGAPSANGKWVITKYDDNYFDLVGSSSYTVYTSGGIASKTPISIIGQYTFVDTGGTEYDIVVGLDSSNNTRIYVYDSASTESSKWVELTRYFDALVNGTPSASALTVTIDTVTENGVAFALGTNTVQYWIVVNTTQSNETVFIVSSTSTILTTDTVLGSSGLGWTDEDVLKIYRFPAIKYNFTAVNGGSCSDPTAPQPWISWLAVEAQRKVTMFYQHTDGTKRQAIQIMKRAARNYFYTAKGGSIQRTLPAGWYVESDFGILNPYSTSEGTIKVPFSTTKTLMIVSNATNTTPIVLTLSDVSDVGNGSLIEVLGVVGNTAANGFWTVANKDAGAKTIQLANSVGNGTYGAGGYVQICVDHPVYDQTGGRNWLSLYTGKYNADASWYKNFRIYVTLTYTDYQESDPVFQGFYSGSVPIAVILTAAVNFSLMNKEVTAINIYGATCIDDVYTAGWIDASNEYFLLAQLKTQTDSCTNFSNGIEDNFTQFQNLPINAKPYFLFALYGSFIGGGGTSTSSSQISLAQQASQADISTALNHAIDLTREYPKPRFGVKVTRSQGALSIIDIDDSTLGCSNTNGSGANEDDNFPNVSVSGDVSPVSLRLYLQSSGEMLGLAMFEEMVHVFRKTERETRDLVSDQPTINQCDFTAKKSLVSFPGGLAWAGEYGIYILSRGGQQTVLSSAIQNKYDGSLMVTGVTPYLTSAYRTAIVGGHSKIYDFLIFVTKMNKATGYEYVGLVYSFAKRGISGKDVGNYERKFNLGTDGTASSIIIGFGNRQSDKTLSIVTPYGILQYPNRSGSYLYQDDVLIDGEALQHSQSKGIPTRIRIVLGELFDLFVKSFLSVVQILVSGTSISTTGKFNIRIYGDNVEIPGTNGSAPILTQPIDQYSRKRGVRPFGSRSSIALQIDLTEGAEYDFKALDISAIEFETGQTQLGNK